MVLGWSPNTIACHYVVVSTNIVMTCVSAEQLWATTLKEPNVPPWTLLAYLSTIFLTCVGLQWLLYVSKYSFIDNKAQIPTSPCYIKIKEGSLLVIICNSRTHRESCTFVICIVLNIIEGLSVGDRYGCVRVQPVCPGLKVAAHDNRPERTSGGGKRGRWILWWNPKT